MQNSIRDDERSCYHPNSQQPHDYCLNKYGHLPILRRCHGRSRRSLKGNPLGARLQDHLPTLPHFLLRSYRRFSVKSFRLYSSFHCLCFLNLYPIIPRKKYLSTIFLNFFNLFLRPRRKHIVQREYPDTNIHEAYPLPAPSHRYNTMRHQSSALRRGYTHWGTPPDPA